MLAIESKPHNDIRAWSRPCYSLFFPEYLTICLTVFYGRCPRSFHFLLPAIACLCICATAMSPTFASLALVLALTNCALGQNTSAYNILDYVDPLIGTVNGGKREISHGNTPNANSPP